jgi:hypothetical protein
MGWRAWRGFLEALRPALSQPGLNTNHTNHTKRDVRGFVEGGGLALIGAKRAIHDPTLSDREAFGAGPFVWFVWFVFKPFFA